MKHFIAWLIVATLSLPVIAQHIRYQFAAPNAVHHEAEISITADGLPLTPALFRMSRSSPGRYATHEFGKNVYNVMAYDGTGKALKVEKAEGDVYKISGHKGTVKVTYTLFANYADGTYSDVDITGYHLNMPATFMWVKGLEKASISLLFSAPDKNRKVATQLKPTSDPFAFSAPDLQYFMDAPTKVTNMHWREWKVANPDNKQYTFRLALDAEAPEALVDNFTEKLKRVVTAGQAVYGELPAYDYGTYTFIASINPYVARGDGMEHRNSTMITLKRDFDGSNELLGVFAHEFFHCWNVERIRPKSLEPFNFERSNMSEALWVAEGFTHYYGDVLLVRAGLLSYDQFQSENSKLVNAVNTPGAQMYTPIENSQRAVFVDAGVSFDRTNYPNMYTSYYTYGGAIALALDLELRARFNKSLDDVMRELWRKFGKAEVPYTLDDVRNALAAVAGNSAYATTFFKEHVYGHQSFDYKKLLEPAGYTLQHTNSGAWPGEIAFKTEENQL
jgi:predicted metalloprotease with PDZ domain